MSKPSERTLNEKYTKIGVIQSSLYSIRIMLKKAKANKIERFRRDKMIVWSAEDLEKRLGIKIELGK